MKVNGAGGAAEERMLKGKQTKTVIWGAVTMG